MKKYFCIVFLTLFWQSFNAQISQECNEVLSDIIIESNLINEPLIDFRKSFDLPYGTDKELKSGLEVIIGSVEEFGCDSIVHLSYYLLVMNSQLLCGPNYIATIGVDLENQEFIFLDSNFPDDSGLGYFEENPSKRYALNESQLANMECVTIQ